MKSKIEASEDYLTELEELQDTFGRRGFSRSRPKSEFPELFITVPDEHETIQIAPFFDVHIGSKEQDEDLLDKHLQWVADTPNVFSFLGGDMFENITPGESKMGHTPTSPEEQVLNVTKKFAKIQHKLLFSIPGNHEDRTMKNSGMSSARRLADNLKVPYFTDYCFANVKWRNQTFRFLAHHGAGGATTAGAQRNAARKELTWFKPDVLITGHLHNPLVDLVYTLDIDQKTGRLFEKTCLVVICPAYLKYFSGYAAKVRLTPGPRGLTVLNLNDDGRIDCSVHARGRRL